MTELQAEQAAAVPRLESPIAALALFDVLIALAAFAVLAILPMSYRQQGAARFRDPLLGVRAVRDLAQPAGRLHRHGLVRARHVLWPRRLRLWPDHAAHRPAGPGRVCRNARHHHRHRRRHRRDLRAAEGNLFCLRDAGVPDADPQHDPVLGVADRRRPGPARRHSAPGLFRHRFVEPRASVYRELRAAGDRASADAPDRAIAVRLYLADDPRQRQPRQLHRHRRLARQAHDLRAGGAVCLDRRHHHGAVRVRAPIRNSPTGRSRARASSSTCSAA